MSIEIILINFLTLWYSDSDTPPSFRWCTSHHWSFIATLLQWAIASFYLKRLVYKAIERRLKWRGEWRKGDLRGVPLYDDNSFVHQSSGTTISLSVITYRFTTPIVHYVTSHPTSSSFIDYCNAPIFHYATPHSTSVFAHWLSAPLFTSVFAHRHFTSQLPRSLAV